VVAIVSSDRCITAIICDVTKIRKYVRIWLKCREMEVREGRQKVTKRIFDLHVVRQTNSGATYEDTVANLSESEREVTGHCLVEPDRLISRV